MRNRNPNIAVLLILAFLIAGCSNGCTQAKNVTKGFTDMTPKEKSTFFMGVYNRNFNETLALAQKPTLTEDEKRMVRVKKEILTGMYVAIGGYNVAISDNTVTSAEKEAEINKLLNQLLAFVDRLMAASIPKPATDNAGVK